METDSLNETTESVQDVSDVDVKPPSNLPCVDFLLSSSASKVVAMAGIASASGSPAAFEDDSPSSPLSKKPTSLSSVASMLSRRNVNNFASSQGEGGCTMPMFRDVKKMVFQTPARTDKRVVGGLRAHTFTSQAFVSSFAVGLAIGSILAIIIKIFSEVGYRLLP